MDKTATLTVVDQYSLSASSSHTFKIYNMPVPDPGAAGELTLEGIDSDNDGVRDDIQRLAVVQADGDLLVQNALTSVASNLQKNILSVEDVELSKQLTHKEINNIRCLQSRVGNTEAASLKYRTIASGMFNTRERFLAYAKISVNFSGEIVSSELPEDQYHTLCE